LKTERDKAVLPQKSFIKQRSYRNLLEKEFMMDNLLVGMTGSIGVIGFSEDIFRFRKKIARNVRVIMSKSATKFVTPFSLRVFSGNNVFVDLFDISEGIYLPHLQLARKSDLFLISPASANIIGKLAHGIADDLISTVAMSAKIPVAIIPHMNSDMWFSKSNQRNVALIKDLGYHVLEPKSRERESESESVIDMYDKNENEIPLEAVSYDEIVDFMKNLLIRGKK
jgi:phosphopantothenoylcysteine decarboxylase